MPNLAEHIARIAQDEALPQRVEEAARQTAVLPVLDALGWDCWDGNEVTPEFEVRGGRVDYCLQVPGQRLVLIEVKRTGTDLTGHQEQLLRYAFDEGVPLAALTDGRVWWLYLPTAAGNWEQRRFFSIDFRQQEASRAAADLERFLSRSDIVSGAALKEAQREFESQERDRRVRAALQDAWKQVLGDPDGLLRDLLAETVKEISGHQPDRDTVAGFLQGISGSGSAEAERPDPPPRREPGDGGTSGQKAAATRHKRMIELLGPETHDWEYVRSGHNPDGVRSVSGARLKAYHVLRDRRTGDEVLVGRGEMVRYASVEPPVGEPEPPREQQRSRGPSTARRKAPPKRIAAFRLDGHRYEVARWQDMLVQVCNLLAEEAGPRFSELVAPLRGRTRPRFSHSPDEYVAPRRLESGLFLEVGLNANTCERRARDVLIAVRGPRGDDSFEIERAG